MKLRKYIVHVTVLGIGYALAVYATSCEPYLLTELTHITRRDFNPACIVDWYHDAPDEIPQPRGDFGHITYSITASTASGDTGVTFSPSAPPEGEV